MKIKAIQVVSLDDGNEITVTFKLDQREEYEDADVQHVLDVVRECQGSRDTNVCDENGDPVAERGPQEGRRRRGAADPTRAAEPVEADAGTDASDPAPAGTRRRRAQSAGASEVPAAPEENASTTTSHSEGGRRRRGAADPTSTQSDAPSTDAPRRRSRSLGEAPASEPNSGGAASIKLTDADLSKAASQAALVLGPEGVKSVLSEFGVKKLNELDEKQRQSFFNALKEDLEKAEAEKGDRVEPPARRRRG